jgi:transposase
MPSPLSLDLRERIVKAYEDGAGTYAKVAALFGVGVATISRLLHLQRHQGSLEPKPHKSGNRPKLSKNDLEALKMIVSAKPDLTLLKLKEELSNAIQKDITTSAVSRGLKKLKITRKKNVSLQ